MKESERQRLKKRLKEKQIESSENKKRYTFTIDENDRNKLREVTSYYNSKSDSTMIAELINLAFDEIE